MLCKLFILTCLLNCWKCAKILGFFFIPSLSHQITYQSVWTELANRGHEVTVFSPNIVNNFTNNNLIENDMSFSYEYIRENPLDDIMKKEYSLIRVMWNCFMWSIKLIQIEFDHYVVKNFLNQTNDYYDLVLIENLNPILYGFGEKFKAPIVGKNIQYKTVH